MHGGRVIAVQVAWMSALQRVRCNACSAGMAQAATPCCFRCCCCCAALPPWCPQAAMCCWRRRHWCWRRLPPAHWAPPPWPPAGPVDRQAASPATAQTHRQFVLVGAGQKRCPTCVSDRLYSAAMHTSSRLRVRALSQQPTALAAHAHLQRREQIRFACGAAEQAAKCLTAQAPCAVVTAAGSAGRALGC